MTACRRGRFDPRREGRAKATPASPRRTRLAGGGAGRLRRRGRTPAEAAPAQRAVRAAPRALTPRRPTRRHRKRRCGAGPAVGTKPEAAAPVERSAGPVVPVPMCPPPPTLWATPHPSSTASPGPVGQRPGAPLERHARRSVRGPVENPRVAASASLDAGSAQLRRRADRARPVQRATDGNRRRGEWRFSDASRRATRASSGAPGAIGVASLPARRARTAHALRRLDQRSQPERVTVARARRR
jgi:hypothetical protein